jgi:metacaspase-1
MKRYWLPGLVLAAACAILLLDRDPVPAKAVPANAAPSSKGISLHIGLNQVDPNAYPGTPDLAACENDATEMEKIAKKNGFKTQILLTKEATSDALFTAIDAAAATLGEGDIFLFTYSGHGGDRADTSPEPDESRDQTLCLYNRQVIDDELGDRWTKFKPGVRIVTIADSCHSGTVAKFARAAKAFENKAVPDNFKNYDESFKKMQAQIKQASEGVRIPAGKKSTIRTVDPIVKKDVNAKQKDILDEIKKNTPKESVSVKKLQASVLHLGACQDDQLAGEWGDHGLFTEAILRLLPKAMEGKSYETLLRGTQDYLSEVPDQRPNLHKIGTYAGKIANEKPFTP